MKNIAVIIACITFLGGSVFFFYKYFESRRSQNPYPTITTVNVEHTEFDPEEFKALDNAIVQAMRAFNFQVMRLEREGKLDPTGGPDLIESDSGVAPAMVAARNAFWRQQDNWTYYRGLVDFSGLDLKAPEQQAMLIKLLECSRKDLETIKASVEVLKRK